MKTAVFHTGLYGDKAAMIVSICRKIRQTLPTIIRSDLSKSSAYEVSQEDEITGFIDDKKAYKIDFANVVDAPGRSELEIYSYDLLGGNTCLDVMLDEYDEVCILVDRGHMSERFLADETAGKIEFYSRMNRCLDVLLRYWRRNIWTDEDIKFEKNINVYVRIPRILLTIGPVKLCSSSAYVSRDDLLTLHDVILDKLKEANYEQRYDSILKYRKHSQEEMQRVIGWPEVDQFKIEAKKLLADAIKNKLEQILKLGEDAGAEFVELEKKLEKEVKEKYLTAMNEVAAAKAENIALAWL